MRGIILLVCGILLAVLICSALTFVYELFGWEQGIGFWTINLVSYSLAIFIVKYLFYKFDL